MSLFGSFFRKQYRSSVTPEDKTWAEEGISWFIQLFGTEHLRKQPFLLPTTANFPCSDLSDKEQFGKLFEQLCTVYSIDPRDVEVQFFDDLASKQWSTWILGGAYREENGLFYQDYSTTEKRFKVRLAKSCFDDPFLLISVLAHELAHVRLLGGNFMNRSEADLEPMTDLACIYFGFGIFTANSSQVQLTNWLSRSGYLPDPLIGYANALVCYISGRRADEFVKYMNSNSRSIFVSDFNYISRTNDTLLTTNAVALHEQVYHTYRRIFQGFEKRDFDEVIRECRECLHREPENTAMLNNLGYALLQQRRHAEAIPYFTKAIGIDPYFEYGFNNRGYCRLQLGDLENALADLKTSFEMNPGNSFAWRNMGAYYFKTGEFVKALEYFEQAMKIDPETEMIHYYLGMTYRKLGQEEKSSHFLNRSLELDEYLDLRSNSV